MNKSLLLQAILDSNMSSSTKSFLSSVLKTFPGDPGFDVAENIAQQREWDQENVEQAMADFENSPELQAAYKEYLRQQNMQGINNNIV